MDQHPASAVRASSPGAAAVTALLLAVALLVGAALPALAHARLVDSSPVSGETLDDPPDEVVLTFNEEVEADFNQIQVRDPEGVRVDAGAAEGDGAQVAVPLQALSVPGTYTVTYRIISADGHAVEGTFEFEVAEEAVAGALPEQEPAEEPQPDETPIEEAAPGEQATPPPLEEDPAAEDDGGFPLALVAIAVLVVLGAVALISSRRGGATEDDPPV